TGVDAPDRPGARHQRRDRLPDLFRIRDGCSHADEGHQLDDGERTHMSDRTEKKRARKSLPQAAWDWRSRKLPGAAYATLEVVEKAFMAGAHWAQRRVKR